MEYFINIIDNAGETQDGKSVFQKQYLSLDSATDSGLIVYLNFAVAPGNIDAMPYGSLVENLKGNINQIRQAVMEAGAVVVNSSKEFDKAFKKFMDDLAANSSVPTPHIERP